MFLRYLNMLFVLNITVCLKAFEFPTLEHNCYTKKNLAVIKNMVCNKDDDFYVVCNKT